MSIRPARRIRLLSYLGPGLALAATLPVACASPQAGCDPGTSPGCEPTTVTRITSDGADPSLTGQIVRVEFEVTAASGKPSGTVEVTSDAGGVERCSASVAVEYCDIRLLSAGSQTLRAAYLGGGGFSGSSDTEPHLVDRARTSTTVVSHSPDPSALGQEIEVSFSVAAEQPGSGAPSGRVAVSDGSSICTAKVRLGRCSLTLSTAGVKTLTATYEGDINFERSGGFAFHEVSAAIPTVTLANGPDPSVVGQPVRVEFEVSSENGTPTGTVTVTVDDGSGASCTASLEQGSCELVLASAGAKMLTATYSGDDSFARGQATTSHQVNQASTTTLIESDDPDPSVIDQEIQVRYSVTVESPGAGTPTGIVTVGDGTDSCSASVTAGSCKLTLTRTGARTLTATYGGDSDFEESSDSENHRVTGAPTTVTLSDTPDPSVVGQPVEVEFSVTSAAGQPTGTVRVTVNDGSDSSCAASVATGQCEITLTRAGDFRLAAEYEGDGSFDGSSSSTSHRVNRAQTTTAITGDAPDPSVVGQSVDVDFSVAVKSPGKGSPSGSVRVSSGSDNCTGTVSQGGCTLTLRNAGARTLSAEYLGDDNFAESSGSEGHQVRRAATTTLITSDFPDPSFVGQSFLVTFAVAVRSPGNGTPTGSVTVTDGIVNCTASVSSGGCNLTPTTAAKKTLTATYSGNANFEPSSGTESHSVKKAETTTVITSDLPDPSITGAPVVVTFSVTADAPGSVTPPGNVTVTDGTASCTATVASGSCTLVLTTEGQRTLTATYAGDANFFPSSDTEDHLVSDHG